MRKGYTTGSCAAAAAKAAVLALRQDSLPEWVTITTPGGQELRLPVQVERGEGWAEAVVIKDAGDDPDITHEVAVHVRAQLRPGPVQIRAGRGVGIVTRPGLAVPVGEPAVNPVPRAMITAAVTPLLPPGEGVELTISIPRGEELARRTLNPRLGIEGGLSILGTTGIVEPMSVEALQASLITQVGVALAAGHKTLVLTPGRMGQCRAVQGYGFPEEVVILTSNLIGDLLEACANAGVKRVLLWGHAGKLVKVAGGIFNTHSRVADGRREIIAAYLAAGGAPAKMVRGVLEAPTVEAVLELVQSYGQNGIWDLLARQASRQAQEFVRKRLTVGTALLNLKGEIIGRDEVARQIMEEYLHG
ncbi:MAG: cobalt-precorrin-5B (C1)-methyltransferase [Clostridia bacterium]|nr:cobalt-precorrin-5B (C1)-methyltransferase [Clostridia bacterium]